MEALLFILSTVAIVWFFVWISAPRKKSCSYENANEINTERAYDFKISEFERTRERNPLDITIRPIDRELLPLPNPILKVIFSFSTSKLLEEIVGLEGCRKKESEYEYVFDFNNLSECKKVYDIVSKWKTAKFFLSTEEADRLEVGQLIRCLIKQKEHGCKMWCDRYDTNSGKPRSLGCRKIVGYMYSNSKSWCDKEFLTEEESCIRIDKLKILKEIKEQARVFRCCPFFNAKKIWENYLRLPAAVNFRDKRWIVTRQNDNKEIELIPRSYGETWQEATEWIDKENTTILSVNTKRKKSE